MAQNTPKIDDLKADENLKRIDDLESFRKELEGKEFDKKVAISIEDSTLIQEKIKKLVWETLKNKITWVILGAVGLVLIDCLRIAITNIPQWFK